MEMKLKGHLVVKEERRADAIVGGGGGGGIKKVSSTVIGRERSSSMESSPRPSSSNHTIPISQEEQLKSTKTEMGEVREENERLKMVLAKVAKDYQSLQMKFFDIVQQEEQNPVEAPPIPPNVEEQQLISLSLGTSASGSKKEEKEKASTSKSKSKEEDDKMEKGLSLGLDCKYQGCSSSTTNHSPQNSSEKAKEEEAGEPWPPSKILKNMRNGENEVAQQAHVKKARVSVRARCDAPTMIDGCQWRKYGQKIAKGNPCPRAYYRCTVAPACPVRKQVQRCAEDMSILITTYEGTHNHPLSISATAMATTTSAAASMLISGSSTSQPAIGGQGAATTAASAISSHCLNFGLSDWRARQFYLPNPTISSNPSYPTITLDLTAPPPSSAQQASQFNRFPSTFTSNSRYPSSSFNFSESGTAPSSWSNGYLGYGTQPYNKSHLGTLKQPQEPYNYQSYLQKATNTAPSQHLLTDTIAKAITSDPSFQSALAAAIKSYVGAQGTQGVGESGAGHSLKWADQHSNSAGAPCTSTPTGNGCASSYLNRTASSTSSNPQQGNLMFLQTPVALSSSKSASASPVETRENIN